MIERLVDPFEALLAMQRRMDAGRPGARRARPAPQPPSHPPVNVFRRGDDLVAVAEVPGVRREDLTVEVGGGQLRISGRRVQVYGEDVSVHRRERRSGEFARAIDLPMEVDAAGVRARLREGTLAVLLPRAERERRRQIEIE